MATYILALIALLFAEGAHSLQLTAAPLVRPATAGLTALRTTMPRAQFGGGGDPPQGLSRDNEEEFFKTNMDEMSDAEKLKSPAVYLGLAILVLPFVVGMIALSVSK